MFKIGQRIIYVGDDYTNIQGKKGKIITVDNDGVRGGSYGIEFDDYMYGHTCGGRTRIGYGWWVYHDSVIPDDVNRRL